MALSGAFAPPQASTDRGPIAVLDSSRAGGAVVGTGGLGGWATTCVTGAPVTLEIRWGSPADIHFESASGASRR